MYIVIMLVTKKIYHKKFSTKSKNQNNISPLDWMPLTQRLFDRLIKTTHHYDIYSDFVATNIWAYMGSSALLCFHEEGVAIRMLDDYDNQPYYTLLARKSSSRLLDEILMHSASEGASTLLRHVPAETIRFLRKDNRVNSIEHDRDNHDYVYSVDKFIHFKNRKLKTRKKELDKLHKKFPNLDVRYDLQHNNILVNDIKKLYKTWIDQTKQVQWQKDYDALCRVMKQQTVPQIIVSIYDEDEMIGFTINELIHKSYYMGFSGKANRKYPGLSIALEHETAKIMKTTYGCKYLNLEQDLGIEGLRNFKLSLSPDRMIKKYKVVILADSNIGKMPL